MKHVVKALAGRRLPPQKKLFQEVTTSLFVYLLKLWRSHLEEGVAQLSRGEGQRASSTMEMAHVCLKSEWAWQHYCRIYGVQVMFRYIIIAYTSVCRHLQSCIIITCIIIIIVVCRWCNVIYPLYVVNVESRFLSVQFFAKWLSMGYQSSMALLSLWSVVYITCPHPLPVSCFPCLTRPCLSPSPSPVYSAICGQSSGASATTCSTEWVCACLLSFYTMTLPNCLFLVYVLHYAQSEICLHLLCVLLHRGAVGRRPPSKTQFGRQYQSQNEDCKRCHALVRVPMLFPPPLSLSPFPLH